MHVRSPLVADEQSAHPVQPGECALDDPAHRAKAGTVLALTAGDDRSDAALADEQAVLVVVIAAVCEQTPRTPAGPPDSSTHTGHRVDERDQLGDIVAVPTGDRVGERDPAGIDEEVMLRPQPAPVDWARARLGAPFFACTWLESITARDHSISPAALNLASNSACRSSHTPACCHSSSLRQHVTPEPNPSSTGRCFHAIPVCNTNKIPDNASRSARRLRPGYRYRRSLRGNNGSTRAHNSSDTTHGRDDTSTPSTLTAGADALRRQQGGPFILKPVLSEDAGFTARPGA